ncbi:hypothetical protein BP5796_09831 [Coleophoma crateriformis]|uniref:NAD-dependent epimerase/dehydratase domain-containing protein n=1 Tax=Coleophoma crateriformis TaxID=565419 RepID=A0A3D8QZ46_9HELO|nr:hypothetical protein BP5796_09831 [Coleophoma crateriformis]
MPTSEDLVLLTGATGFIGYVVLVKLLEAGYPVRCAVRSPSKIEQILSAPSITALGPIRERVSWVVVPDMTAQHAYDEGAKGAKYIIHVAFPIPSLGKQGPLVQDLEKIFIEPAKRGTIDLLETAKRAGSVKRVVFTSSIVAIIPDKYFLAKGDDRIFDAESRIPSPSGPYQDDKDAYRASKAIALNQSEAYIQSERPDFDIVSIIPGWVLGKNELLVHPDQMALGGSNSMLLSPLLGHKNQFHLNKNYVHVDDVAKLHVLALGAKVEGNQAFVASSDGLTCPDWEDAFPIVEQEFPEAVREGRLKTTGKQPSHSIRIDGTKTKDVLAIDLVPFKVQVKDVAGQYLKLFGKA